MHREPAHTIRSRIRGLIEGRAAAYLVVMFFLALTGFAQMPIFKRYYIADIPGLGWLDRYLVTHYIHYLTAVLLLFMVSYRTALHVLEGRYERALTAAGFLRSALLFGIIASGALLGIRNLSGAWLPSGLIIFMDLTHLGLVMVFLTAALCCRIFKQPWTRGIPVKLRSIT